MATLTVGAGQQFSTIAAAVNASLDGDLVQVQAGTYTNDFATIRTKITIEGVGGMAKLVATVSPPNGKAILVTTTDVTLDHLELSGAKVTSKNGAGVRYEGGNLTITNSYFHHNENGLLSNADAAGSISIKASEFSHNGAGDGYSHNLYVGAIGNLTIDRSYFHDAVVGHEIKSRAYSTTITNSRIFDGPNGNASYSIDLPNAGKAVLTGNIIEQGPLSKNPAIVHFGGESNDYAGSSLQMTSNTAANDLTSGSTFFLLNHTTATASISDTTAFGLSSGQMASGPASVSGTLMLASQPAYDGTSPWATSSSPALPPAFFAKIFTGDGRPNTLVGSGGGDRIEGGKGNDDMTGGVGADSFVLSAGEGSDTITDFVSGTDKLIFQGLDASQVTIAKVSGGLQLSYGRDKVLLSGVASIAPGDVLYGPAALLGTSGADTLNRSSATGPASLSGLDGADILNGGNGADWLNGGRGNDVLTGGAGSDSFVFVQGDGRDRIQDFASGVDQIYLNGTDSSSVKASSVTLNGVSGTEIAYGTAGHTIFLVGVQGLTIGDLIFT